MQYLYVDKKIQLCRPITHALPSAGNAGGWIQIWNLPSVRTPNLRAGARDVRVFQ